MALVQKVVTVSYTCDLGPLELVEVEAADVPEAIEVAWPDSVYQVTLDATNIGYIACVTLWSIDHDYTTWYVWTEQTGWVEKYLACNTGEALEALLDEYFAIYADED